MANFGLYEKPYIRFGTSGDVCYCCVKEECEKGERNAHDVTHELTGKVENKMVFYIRRSGVDTCICFDCFKKIYEGIIAFEMPTEEVAEPVQTEVTEEPAKKTAAKKTTK